MVLRRCAITMRGATRHQTAEVILDGALRFGVERAGRFIENQDRRIVVDRARDGDALFLSAGKRKPDSPIFVS